MATSTSRLAELARALRGRRVVTTVIVATVAMAASLAVSRSSLLRMRHLEVDGNSNVTRAQVVQLAALSQSTNVLWFDAVAVERRLESDPWIASASVSRRLPGTIQISVVERSPIAMIRDAQGFTMLAADGVALGTVGADPGLPEIVVLAGSTAPGEDLPVQAAAKAIAKLAGGKRPGVVRAVIDAGALSVELDGGTLVEFGDPTEIDAKAAAAQQILRWATAQGASVASVNVTAPDSPAATLA